MDKNTAKDLRTAMVDSARQVGEGAHHAASAIGEAATHVQDAAPEAVAQAKETVRRRPWLLPVIALTLILLTYLLGRRSAH